MSYTGFSNAALQMGYEAIMIRPKRGIFNARYSDLNNPGSTIKMPDIKAMAVIRERHMDQLEITDHPVEQGANISDHAFKRPAEVTLEIAWSNSPTVSNGLISSAVAAGVANSNVVKTGAAIYGAVQAIQSVQSALAGVNPDQMKKAYDTLLELQTQRALFDLTTGKRQYTNMVCKTLSVETDERTENALFITMVCHQVILVNTQTVSLPKSSQKNPSDTASTIDQGTKSLVPATLSQ
jgi:hypothetical protein